MPFKSKAQMRWMFANDPEMAKRWAKHTENVNKIPEKVKQALVTLKPNKATGVQPAPAGSPPPPIAPNYSQQYGSSLQEAVKQRGGSLAAPQNKQGSFLAKLAEGTPIAGVTNITPPGTQYQPNNPPIIPKEQQPPVVAPVTDLPRQSSTVPKPTSTGVAGRAMPEPWHSRALPSSVAGRMQSNRPEDLQHATAIHNLSPFRQSMGDTPFSPNSDKAVTSKDIDSLHNFHNDQFKEFVNRGTGGTETDTKAYESVFPAGSPRVFDLISGKAGTPEQQQAAHEFLGDLEQRKARLENRAPAVATAQSDAANYEKQRQDRAAFDAKAKEWTGLDVPSIDKLNGPGSWIAGSSGNQNAQNRTWFGDKKNQGFFLEAGTAANSLRNSPLGQAASFIPMIGAAQGVADLGALFGGYEGMDTRYGNTGSALTGLATDNPMAKEYGRTAGQMIGFGSMALRGAGAARSAFNRPTSSFKPLGIPFTNSQLTSGAVRGGTIGLLAAGSGLGGLGVAATALSPNNPSLGEVRRGQRNEAPSSIANTARYARDLMQPESDTGDSGPNTLPNYSNLSKQLEGVNPYALAGDFNLGEAGRHPEMASIDGRIAGMSSLPPEQQAQEKANIDQVLSKHMGSNLGEYTQYSESNKALYASYDTLEKAKADYSRLSTQTRDGTVGDTAAFSTAAAALTSARDSVSDAQQRSAVQGLPFMTKALDKRYEKEIKPIEEDAKTLAGLGAAVKAKIQNGQQLTNEDMAAIHAGHDDLNTLRDFSYDKARLEFMGKGKLTPESDQFLSDKSPEGVKSLNQLFSGKPEPVMDKNGKPVMETAVDPNTGQKVEVAMMQNSNVLLDTLNKNMNNQLVSIRAAQQSATVPSGVNGSPPPPPSTTSAGPIDQAMDYVHNEMLGGMQPWEKWLVYGGVALTAIGALSSMFGGSGDDDEEGGGGWMSLLGMLGAGAAIGLPIANHFGYNLSSLFGSDTPPATGATGAGPAAPVTGTAAVPATAGAKAPGVAVTLPPYNPGKNTPAQTNAELSKLNQSANQNERTVAQDYVAKQFAGKTNFFTSYRAPVLKILKDPNGTPAQLVKELGNSHISLQQAEEFMRYPDETLAALARAGVR